MGMNGRKEGAPSMAMKWPPVPYRALCKVVIRCLLVVCLAATALPIGEASPEIATVLGTTRVAGRPAADVVVWLDALQVPGEPRTAKVVLDQRNLNFYPHVLAVRVGTTVDFPNDDRVFHNVFSFKDGKQFDLGMYPVGALRHVTFDKPGLSRIFCNIHPNMAAYVMAVDSPYFAVSDQTGAFKIPGVAVRDAQAYHAWRAGSTELSGMWTPASAPMLTIDWP
jgi:plastocyanin